MRVRGMDRLYASSLEGVVDKGSFGYPSRTLVLTFEGQDPSCNGPLGSAEVSRHHCMAALEIAAPTLIQRPLTCLQVTKIASTLETADNSRYPWLTLVTSQDLRIVYNCLC